MKKLTKSIGPTFDMWLELDGIPLLFRNRVCASDGLLIHRMLFGMHVSIK